MLYLASRSPRRRQLLETLGYRFQCLDVDVPEVPVAGEQPLDYIRRVALDKGRAGRALIAQKEPSAVVLSGDTDVVLDGEVLGKPADRREAAAMLARLSGRTHEVISVIWALDAQQEQHVACRTRVHFMPLSQERIQAYLATGEFEGKAGGYGVQGRAGAFITGIEGSHSAVVGLPLHQTDQLLRMFRLQPETAPAEAVHV